MREIVSLEPDYIKIPSACNLRFDMLRELARTYEGDLHIPLGMTTPDEVAQIVGVLRAEHALERTVLYACTSGYPVPFDQLCLLEIRELVAQYGGELRAVGFSGHHLGIAADVAAYTLGAQWIERHFTLDRTWKGTDHAASLEPDGLRRLVRDVRAVSQALTLRDHPILDIEVATRKKLKRFSHKPEQCAGSPICRYVAAPSRSRARTFVRWPVARCSPGDWARHWTAAASSRSGWAPIPRDPAGGAAAVREPRPAL